MALLLGENRRHETGGQKNARGATLNADPCKEVRMN